MNQKLSILLIVAISMVIVSGSSVFATNDPIVEPTFTISVTDSLDIVDKVEITLIPSQ